MTSTVAAQRTAAQTRVRWELLVGLVRKDLSVKYKGSALGFAWSLATPLALMAVYWLVFSVVLRNGIPHFPYYLMCGLLAWSCFQGGVQTSSGAIVGNSGLVKKVRFPLTVLPMSTVGFALVHFVLQLGTLLVIMLLTGFDFWGWQMIMIIPATALLILFTTGMSLLVSALNVRYRDVQHLVDVAMLGWFFANPIVYGAGLVKDHLDHHGLYWAYFLNPMASVVGTFQGALYKIAFYTPPGSTAPKQLLIAPTPYRFYFEAMGISTVVALAVFALGLTTFRRLSGDFAEEL